LPISLFLPILALICQWFFGAVKVGTVDAFYFELEAAYMQLRKNLIMGFLGLAMLAAPLTASAQDYYYRHYGRPYYGYGYNRPYADPYEYAMPRGYGGGACAQAQHLRNVYNQDRWRGHPAAANDLIPRMREAERACSGGGYGYNGYRYRRYGYNRWRW
jgi:hypothetical protein